MTDNELNGLLNTVQPPTESARFRQTLPRRVLARLNAREPNYEFKPDAASDFGVADLSNRAQWIIAGLGLAAACIAFLLVLSSQSHLVPGINDKQLAEARKYYEELSLLFPNQLRVIILKSPGPELSLSEKPNIPDSKAVFLSIAGPLSRGSFVVLNGQEFSFAGKRYEVLLDSQDDVLVIGPDTAWSSGAPEHDSGPLKIAARVLGNS